MKVALHRAPSNLADKREQWIAGVERLHGQPASEGTLPGPSLQLSSTAHLAVDRLWHEESTCSARDRAKVESKNWFKVRHTFPGIDREWVV